jgi:Zn-dependent protease
MSQVQSIILMVLPLMFSVILHEVSHGWTAEKLGDPTARLLGRITLNPLPHVDLFGTILLPALLIFTHAPFLIGWAKPVPVNFGNLRGGRRDMALVAISGPATNFLLAVVSALLFHLTSGMGASGFSAAVVLPIHAMAYYSVLINLVLMVFNLLPILPLDGGRIAVGLLPESIAIPLQRTERWGMLLVLLFVVSDMWRYLVSPVINVLLHILGMRI